MWMSYCKKEEFKNAKIIVELKHKYRMEEIEFERKAKVECETLKHENEMTRQRIKAAEIRKTQMRKHDAYKY